MLEEPRWATQVGKLKGMLASFRVTPDVPAGRIPKVGEDDLDDVRLPIGDQTAAWSLFITYGDAKKEETHRRVSCKRVALGLGGSEILYAYCHERRAPRAFRVDRIIDAFDASTGEVVDPRGYLLDLRSRGLPFADNGMATFAKLCTFMSRCDGNDDPREWQAIEHGLTRYAIRFGGDDSSIETAMAAARNLSPDSADFLKCLSAFRRASRGPALARLAIETCAEIIDADGVQAPEEITWSLEVSNMLKSIAARPS